MLFAAGFQTGAGHALAQATFGEKGLFQSPDLLVQEVVGLMDEANQDVGDNVAERVSNRSYRSHRTHRSLPPVFERTWLRGNPFPKWLTASA